VRNALVLLLVLVPGVAHGGRGDNAFSAGAAVGTFTLPGEEEDETVAPTAGGLAFVEFERGLSEALSWRVEASGGLYGGGGVSWSGSAALGIVYRFDVLKYVPYAALEVGGSYVGGGPVPEAVLDPVVLIAGGVDFLKSRTRSWGIEGRLSSFLGDTTLFSLGARYTSRWGFF
jgi:hypothetical protein